MESYRNPLQFIFFGAGTELALFFLSALLCRQLLLIKGQSEPVLILLMAFLVVRTAKLFVNFIDPDFYSALKKKEMSSGFCVLSLVTAIILAFILAKYLIPVGFVAAN